MLGHGARNTSAVLVLYDTWIWIPEAAVAATTNLPGLSSACEQTTHGHTTSLLHDSSHGLSQSPELHIFL